MQNEVVPTRIEQMGSPYTEMSPTSLSNRLWGVDWCHAFPKRFGGVTVERVPFARAATFMKKHYAKVFGGAEHNWLAEPMTEAKRRFCEDSDTFLFTDDQGEEVGLFITHPSDWSTYYVRSTCILPHVRERGLCGDFLTFLGEQLAKVGVARLEAECSPMNAGAVGICSKLGWVVTSSAQTDRWGTMIKFTKFLDPGAEAVFRRQFSAFTVKTKARNDEQRNKEKERKTS